ncbi:glycosyltransferase involved in cell wall biosynthesis [Desulfitispora alkaliphila]|uniref:glycosyltransferase family 2 protein n=1 Tax=Desulfitispora alkaliphila TaxID=622674 RepID=UPI003D22CA62
MSAIVIPARDEAGRILILLNQILSYSAFNPIVVVINGSIDNTAAEVLSLNSLKVKALYFSDALGYDIPRAIGAHYAYNQGAHSVIFVDGDMVGDILHNLIEIDAALNSGVDLALTNCYPYITKRQPLSASTLKFRQLLNKKLGLYQNIGLATPSHGLSGVSKRLMDNCHFSTFAIPPTLLSIAKLNNLTVKVATAVPHLHLGSKVRGSIHARKIAHTIIGDCIEAKCIYDGTPRTRNYLGFDYIGYNNQRRFDLLEKYLRSKSCF